MAAPRNDKARKQIYDAAIRLFSEHGYAKTKYSDIAAACGTTKSTVQHYFPKKDLFVTAYFEEYLARIADDASKIAQGDAMRMFCFMGLAHFDFLLNDEQMLLFNRDIVSSRDLTSIIVDTERDWAAKQLVGQAHFDVSVEDSLTVALGGAFELAYQSLNTGRHVTAATVERTAFTPFALYLGYPRETIDRIIDECLDVFAGRKEGELTDS